MFFAYKKIKNEKIEMRIIIKYFLLLSTEISKVHFGGFSSLESNLGNLSKFIIDIFNFYLIWIFKQIKKIIISI